MSFSAAAAHRQPDDTEGPIPSFEAPSPGVLTTADSMEGDDDDIEFQPSTEHSENSDAMDDMEDSDEYLGM